METKTLQKFKKLNKDLQDIRLKNNEYKNKIKYLESEVYKLAMVNLDERYFKDVKNAIHDVYKFCMIVFNMSELNDVLFISEIEKLNIIRETLTKCELKDLKDEDKDKDKDNLMLLETLTDKNSLYWKFKK